MTNAGKTHTIQGSASDPGLLPRVVRAVLGQRRPAHSEVRLSMLEIYQDKIYDLLSFRRENLHIRDNGGQVDIAKLTHQAVSSVVSCGRI